VPTSAPAVSAPPDISFDEDDDDLPRPGRVWDSHGPSLKELLAAQASATHSADAAVAVAPPPDSEASNVEPVSTRDLPGVWRQLLTEISSQGPILHSVLSGGRLSAIHDGMAIVTLPSAQETFVRRMESNGKKDVVRAALTKVLNEPVGLRFEVDAAPSEPAPSAAPARAAEAPRPRPTAPPPPRPAAPEPAGTPPMKLTPELIDSLRESEPLVKTLMDDLGATIVKVEGE
jgi:hypothetical protein